MTKGKERGKLIEQNKVELEIRSHRLATRRSLVNTEGCSTSFSGWRLILSVYCKRRRIFAYAFVLFHSALEVLTISKKDLFINEEIRDKEVRVIGPDGNPLGIMSSKDALAIAHKENLDLVNISPKAVPPVCRIMDYGKYRFEQAKREKEAKKKQKVVEIKEIRLSLKIDTHDFETKVNQAKKFLEHGDRVKVAIRFRGREMAHPELGQTTIQRFAEACSEVGVIDKQPKMEGRSLVMFISAKPANNTKPSTKREDKNNA